MWDRKMRTKNQCFESPWFLRWIFSIHNFFHIHISCIDCRSNYRGRQISGIDTIKYHTWPGTPYGKVTKTWENTTHKWANKLFIMWIKFKILGKMVQNSVWLIKWSVTLRGALFFSMSVCLSVLMKGARIDYFQFPKMIYLNKPAVTY